LLPSALGAAVLAGLLLWLGVAPEPARTNVVDGSIITGGNAGNVAVVREVQ